MTVERLKRNWKPIAVIAAVGLLALIAIALLIRFLSSGPPGTADGSPTGNPSSSFQVTPSNPAPSPAPVTPTPTGTPVVTVDQPLPPGAGPTSFWARVLVNDLRVRDAPGTSGKIVDAVSAGDVVYALEAKEVAGATWYSIFKGGKGTEAPPPRWVAAGPPDGRYLARLGGAPRKLPDEVRGLAAGPSGYLAFGTTERTTENQSGAPLIMTSADGTSWTRQSADAFKGAAPNSAAGGPGGWVVVAYSGPSNSNTVWLSADGRSWDEVGQGPGGAILPDTTPYSVAGSAAGYLLPLSGTNGNYLTFSKDGRSWAPSEFGNVTPISTGETFVAIFGPDPAPPPLATLRIFEGGKWVDVAANEMPAFEQPQWAASGKAFVMFDRSVVDKKLLVWAGSIAADRLSWRRQTSAEAAFAGAGVSAVVGSSSGFLVTGWDAATMAPITWTSTDGVTWKRIGHAAEDFGGPITQVVRAPIGGVALGSDPRPGYDAQHLFRSDDLVTWSPVEVATLDALDPTAGGCPQLPGNMGDLLGTDGELGAACFGDRPITVRGFATDCGGCGGYTLGNFEPGWLATPLAGADTFLAPFEVDAGYGRSVIVHPDIADQWVDNRWLEVTGHFDDPAASTCHETLPLEYWGAAPVPRDYLVATCRQRFVVTAIKVVAGP